MAIKDIQTVTSKRTTVKPNDVILQKELRPCPFCGKPARIKRKADTLRGDKYTAQCSDKNCIGRVYRAYVTAEQAKKAWNRRDWR